MREVVPSKSHRPDDCNTYSRGFHVRNFFLSTQQKILSTSSVYCREDDVKQPTTVILKESKLLLPILRVLSYLLTFIMAFSSCTPYPSHTGPRLSVPTHQS